MTRVARSLRDSVLGLPGCRAATTTKLLGGGARRAEPRADFAQFALALPAGAPARRASGCSTSAAATAASRQQLARAGAQVVGVDVAEEPLRRARAHHPGLDLRLISAEGAVAACGCELRRRLGGRGDRARRRHRRLALGAAARAALRRAPAAQHARARAAAQAAARAVAGAPSRRTSTRAAITCASTRARTLARLLADFGFDEIDVRARGRARRCARRLLLACARGASGF